MDNKTPRWANEKWTTVTPDNNIVCKTCKFRLKPVEVSGKTFERYTYGECDIYKYPSIKPYGVLWNNSECEYYKKDVSEKI